MANFTSYVDDSLKNLPETKALYRFKQDIIKEMSDRENELIATGLKDQKVICDLIISEYPDLKAQYINKQNEKKKQAKKAKQGKLTILGAIGYILALTAAYLGVSFVSGAWSKTWLLMVGGIFALIIGGTVLSVKKSAEKRDAFSPLSRIMLFVSVMLTATFIFLCSIILFSASKSWLIFILAVAAGLVVDGAFAAVTKQKLAIISHLIYIPAVSALCYVSACLMGILSWHPGWLIIVAAVVADLVIIAGKISKNKSADNEEVDVWSEN